MLVQGGVELLFPLPFVKDQRSLRTSVFWDVGNVFDTNCGSKPDCTKVGFSDMASSVGLGVTWITALGPLSFSFGNADQEAGRSRNPGVPILSGADLLRSAPCLTTTDSPGVHRA